MTIQHILPYTYFPQTASPSPVTGCTRYIPLNEKGEIVINISAVVRESFNQQRVPSNRLQALTYFASDILEICTGCYLPFRYRRVNCESVIALGVENTDEALESALAERRQQFHSYYDCVAVHENHETVAAPPLDKDLIRKIQQVLHTHLILNISEPVLEQLVTAYYQGLEFQKGRGQHTITVSSKSPFFRNIHQIAKQMQKTSSKLIASASVRVYPAGSATICLPFQRKIRGGSKILTKEIYISNEGYISLAMRSKITKGLRSNPTLSLFKKTIFSLRNIHSTRILKPLIAFSSPNKKAESIALAYSQDAFSYLWPFHQFLIDPSEKTLFKYAEILNRPLLKQLEEVVKIMVEVTEGVRDLHLQNILHNDIKPANILLSQDELSLLSAVLTDLDFSCSIEEGNEGFFSLGTKGYVDPDIVKRNFSTDLFALSKTFWMDTDSSQVCFMDCIETLQYLAQQKNEVEVAHLLYILKKSLMALCDQMQNGICSTKSVPTVDITYVHKKLLVMKSYIDDVKETQI
ncbi:MAG: protein kinase family protein [Chlamydiae bacterium]|nr:protein kinase family protein [Chlamydiota bacterium]